MTVEYVRYRIEPDRTEAFLAAYGAAWGPLTGSPWCLGAGLARCVEDPQAFILRIEWTSVEDHLGGFRASEAFRAFLAPIRPFVGAIEEMRHYQSLLDDSGAHS